MDALWNHEEKKNKSKMHPLVEILKYQSRFGESKLYQRNVDLATIFYKNK